MSTISRLVQKMYDAIDVGGSRSTFMSVACHCQIVDEEDHTVSCQRTAQDGIVGGDGLQSVILDSAKQKQIPDNFLDSSCAEKSLLVLIPADSQAAISFCIRVYDDRRWLQLIEETRSRAGRC